MPKRRTLLRKELKIPRNFRLFPDTIRRLKIAAAETGLSETSYMEVTLRERFKREGIKWAAQNKQKLTNFVIARWKLAF
jgi:hypothetical protein